MIDFDIETTLRSGKPITLTAEEVQKSIEFLVELQRRQLEWRIKPMFLPYGMKMIDTPRTVHVGCSA